MAQLGDFLKSINNKTSPVDPIEVEDGYVPYVINRTMSYFMDCVLYANEMNRYPDAPKQQQYDYYVHAIRKRNRFSRWTKPEKETKRMALLKEYYGYNNERAREALKIIPDSELVKIAKKLYKGGQR